MATADALRRAKEEKKKSGNKNGQIDALKERFTKHNDRIGKKLVKEFKTKGQLITVDVSDILDSTKFQIRAEQISDEDFHSLKQGIKENGQLTPVFLRPAGDKYELLAGFNRRRVCKELRIPVLAICKDVSDEQAYIIAEEENINRSEMSVLDMCSHIKTLKDTYKMDYDAIAKRLHKSTRLIRLYEDIYNNPRLLKLIKNEIIKLKEAIKITQASAEEQDRMLRQLEGVNKKNIKSEKKKIMAGTIEPITINEKKKKFKISLSGKFKDAEKTIEKLREIIERLKKLGN